MKALLLELLLRFDCSCSITARARARPVLSDTPMHSLDTVMQKLVDGFFAPADRHVVVLRLQRELQSLVVAKPEGDLVEVHPRDPRVIPSVLLRRSFGIP